MSIEKLISIKEAMEILKVSRSKVYSLIKEGKIETIKMGDKKQSAIRIKKVSLEKYINNL